MLLSEPKLHPLATTLSVLKGETSKLLKGDRSHFWKTRYFNFNVLTSKKLWEKLNYIHQNPVVAGLSKTRRTGDGPAPNTMSRVSPDALRSNPSGHGAAASGSRPHPCRR